ncbi:MAG: glucosaminidase domain-containing protein [Candidatus Aphodosoma sp.]
MKKTIIIFSILFSTTLIFAQNRNAKYDSYIEKYAKLAVQSQTKHRIPASITLAQGLLESGAGESRLAKECNNHFGIKCGGSWYGKSMRMNDDALNECFRCYNNPKDSYDDHAEFLKKTRYSFLFDYKINDYKSWAKGLKKAGYATDPNYPTKLINIIETYKLYEYDEGGKLLTEVKQSDDNTTKEFTDNIEEINGENDQLFGYQEIKNNGVRCYKLMNDDSYQHIAKVTGISLKMLLYYNDLPKECPLYKDDYVYLAPKKRNAAKKTPKYTVKAGDSMHSISQEYGIKLKSLYKINNIEYGTPAKVGQKLNLRK